MQAKMLTTLIAAKKKQIFVSAQQIEQTTKGKIERKEESTTRMSLALGVSRSKTKIFSPIFTYGRILGGSTAESRKLYLKGPYGYPGSIAELKADSMMNMEVLLGEKTLIEGRVVSTIGLGYVAPEEKEQGMIGRRWPRDWHGYNMKN